MSQGKHVKNNDSNNQSNIPKKKSKVKVIIITVFFLLIIGIGLGATYVYSTLNKMDIKKIAQDDKSLGIDESNKDLFQDGIFNNNSYNRY